MVDLPSRRVGPAAGLCIDAVEALPSDLGSTLVRVTGSWEGRPPAIGAPVLVLGDGGGAPRVPSLPETSAAAARVAREDRPFRAAFSVPDRLAALLRGPLALDLGSATIALPATSATAGPGVPQAEATVVDRAVVAERRARRAELAESAAARRAQEAERALATMESELAALELRLAAAAGERAGVEAELGRRDAELRASRQHAHAEQRLREDAVAAAERRTARAGREASQLRHALVDVERGARAAEAALATARRQADEAQQRARIAIAGARRADAGGGRERDGRPPPGLAVLRAEHTLAYATPRLGPPPRPGGLGPSRTHRGLHEQERRAARARAGASGAPDWLARAQHAQARAEEELGRRLLGLSREANRLRARADRERRGREAAEAELEALARAGTVAQAKLAAPTAAAPEASWPAPDPPRAPERRWLAAGLDRLRAQDATAGARLALEVLSAQALAGRSLSYDLLVRTVGWHEVKLGPAGASVIARHAPRARRAADFRLTATPAGLVTLVTEGGSGGLRRRGVRVTGTLRRGRALRSLPAVALDPGALADAGVWIDPLLLHRALALSIDPAWTRGHEFRLEHTVEGPRGTRCFVTVEGGDRVSVGSRPPPSGATTAVRTSHHAFQRALGEGAGPAEGEGDVRALSLLIRWARCGEDGAGQRPERASGAPARHPVRRLA